MAKMIIQLLGQLCEITIWWHQIIKTSIGCFTYFGASKINTELPIEIEQKLTYKGNYRNQPFIIIIPVALVIATVRAYHVFYKRAMKT